MQQRAPRSALDTRAEAERLAAALPPLLVDAERVAMSVAQGLHGRRRVGTGEAFWQFRRYQIGDTAQQIDWRQSARSTHHFVREKEWEASECVWLWCDRSPSMRYRSDGASIAKDTRAQVLLIALATLLTEAGERIAALDGGEVPSASRLGLRRFATHLARLDEGPSLPATRPLPRHARVVFASDFLSPLDDIAERLRAFAADGVSGHLLQVLDPAEEDLPFTGRTRFEGLEDPVSLTFGRAESVRARYQAVLAAHRETLAATARHLGWSFAAHRTDHAPQLALLALHGAIGRGHRPDSSAAWHGGAGGAGTGHGGAGGAGAGHGGA